MRAMGIAGLAPLSLLRYLQEKWGRDALGERTANANSIARAVSANSPLGLAQQRRLDRTRNAFTRLRAAKALD